MHNLNRKLPSVRTNQFSMVPRGDVPRSTFHTQHTHKATYQGNFLYPFFLDEVLPGDVHKGRATIFMRMATALFPIMDDIFVETFFFFCPNRLVWDNWVKFMGERANPADSISFLVPKVTSAAGGFAVGTIYDHFGLPTLGAVPAASTYTINNLPARAYNLIFNEWFRDENVQASRTVDKGNGPDTLANYAGAQRRMKKHDYFTSALPWPTKANDIPVIPLGTSAPVRTAAAPTIPALTPGNNTTWWNAATGAVIAGSVALGTNGGAMGTLAGAGVAGSLMPANLFADLSQATGATLNAMRLAVATQHLLERDARGGTRYTELLQNHFGVTPEDFRLQRPEYIGGGAMQLQTQAIAQTSATGLTGGTSPLAALASQTLGADQHRFSYAAREHGYILGLINVRANVTYQQGIHRMFTRNTRYDFYWPAFALLGEQVVRNDELYAIGGGVAQDSDPFGYQERWAELRHRPSRIVGLFRSGVASSIDTWHLAQRFTALPVLNEAFIMQDTPYSRVLAAGAAADNQQFIADIMFDISCTRALPIRSVPGLKRF